MIGKAAQHCRPLPAQLSFETLRTTASGKPRRSGVRVGDNLDRAVRCEAYDAATTKSSMLSMGNTASNWAFVVSGDYGQQSHHAGVQRISRPYASHRRPRIWSTTETNFIMVVVSVDCRPEQDFRFRTFVSGRITPRTRTCALS